MNDGRCRACEGKNTNHAAHCVLAVRRDERIRAEEREACIRDIDAAFERDEDIAPQDVIRARSSAPSAAPKEPRCGHEFAGISEQCAKCGAWRPGGWGANPQPAPVPCPGNCRTQTEHEAFSNNVQVLDALESIKASLGDRLLAKGPLSKEYARSVVQKMNEAIALLERP